MTDYTGQSWDDIANKMLQKFFYQKSKREKERGKHRIKSKKTYSIICLCRTWRSTLSHILEALQLEKSQLFQASSFSDGRDGM